MTALPIDAYLDRIVADVRRSRAAVVTAAPGAGKTTRVPPALAADGPVILLQPRRVAARAIAARIASERGWTLGREAGWQIRFDRKFTAETQLLVVTEGILTARLQSDPLLSGFNTIVLDEFHERSIHADLAIALARQAWRARAPRAASRGEDLRLVVMSATLDSKAVSSFLDDCPVIDVPGRVHPVDVSYAPGQSVADAAVELLATTSGQVLCFLPGTPEIRRAMADLQPRAGGEVEILPLHGSLDADEQDRALRPSDRRRIIVATNLAETSLTVPGVTAVVDTGLHKVARYDADRGIDSLETERITADAADQRAGRAGRLAPGVVRRLWDTRDRLRPHREPEIHRVDLSSTALEVIAWGGDPRTLEWFERPGEDALEAALALLERLGLIEVRRPDPAGVRRPRLFGPGAQVRKPGPFGPALHSPGIAQHGAAPRLTDLGERVRRLPLHPRLARILVAANGARRVAQACAILSERHLLPPRTATTSSDLLSALDQWSQIPPHVKRVADVIADLGMRNADSGAVSNSAVRTPQSAMSGEGPFLRAILSGYPDRVAQRRAPGRPEVLLASGTGAVLGRESGVHDAEFLVALDVSHQPSAVSHQPSSLPRVRLASRVEREWLVPTVSETVHRFDEASDTVKASTVDCYDALVLSERPVKADPEIAARLLADAWLARGPNDDDARLLRRLRFAGRDIDLPDLVRTAAYGARSLDAVRIADALPRDVARDLERDAPDSLVVPSGGPKPIEYNEDGTVSVSVKLQELFGLVETPRIGKRREPVVLALLAPNGRPVQVTRDLRSFWNRTYPEVRKELRGRYPKHPWPEDPWTAAPAAKTEKRKLKREK
ncbi:MAG: ATP-dependent helicase HrpB [Acidobacteria bacterium]|nr:ATP-dependent helicase HrpB [Acidobacteriota bacterium]